MYQVSEQVNVIRPGGKAQNPHRDYHLGFQTASNVAKFPLHVQTMVSPMLTLQGAVAHVDVPIEAGPTKLLPFSQQYEWGYLAWNRDDFRRFFEENYVQLPLKKGDMLFFNPALFHAGGENTSSDIHRTVNLLQVSSPFGRCMESIDRVRMSKALYPVLLNTRRACAGAALSEKADFEESCSIAACAEAYQFPSNLDRDVPKGAAANESQADLFKRSLQEGLSAEAFSAILDKWLWEHASH
jgi:ectoine hydroxylase-related dioxygenase (phytanoyl-CoA dioxygenase family)